MKICSTCHTEQPLNNFYKLKKSNDGRGYQCKTCISQYQKARYKLPGIKEEIIRRGTTWKKDNPQSILKSHLKVTYGLSKEYYDKLLIESNGQCNICGKNFRFSKDCYIDHDHSLQQGDTGFIRGLLCLLCNTKLGVKEDEEWNNKATAYLEA